MSTSSLRDNFLSFTGRAKILHTTWFAFFVTFLVWFSHAPLLAAIQETMGLSPRSRRGCRRRMRRESSTAISSRRTSSSPGTAA